MSAWPGYTSYSMSLHLIAGCGGRESFLGEKYLWKREQLGNAGSRLEGAVS